MKILSILILSTLLSTSWAAEEQEECPGVKHVEIAKVEREYFDDISFFLGYEQVDWTVDDNFQGGKVILKLHTKAKTINTEDEGQYDVKYIIADIDFTAGIGSDGVEYSYLNFRPISKHEAHELNKGDGVRIIKKVVNYAQFTLKKDIPIGQKLYASFEPVSNEIAIGYALTNNLQLELNGRTAVGYSIAESTNPNYEDVSNIYVGVGFGAKAKHKEYGTVGFDYGVNSGVVVQNVRPGSPVDTSREGLVKVYYQFELAKNTDCEVFISKRSFQIDPGYDELTHSKQDRLYEKAKSYRFGCESRF